MSHYHDIPYTSPYPTTPLFVTKNYLGSSFCSLFGFGVISDFKIFNKVSYRDRVLWKFLVVYGGPSLFEKHLQLDGTERGTLIR